MRYSSQDIVLLNSTLTSSGSGSDINIPEGFIGLILCIQVTAASGTSPTLNLFLQDKIFAASTSVPDAVLSKGTGTAIYDDFYAATQITGTATKVARFVCNPSVGSANAASITSADYAISDAALTAGSIRPGPIGNIWRPKWTIAGTSPSFTTNITAKLIPWA